LITFFSQTHPQPGAVSHEAGWAGAQYNRHSGGKQLVKLAKSIARILLVAGLESGTSSRGVGAVTILDNEFSGVGEQCFSGLNHAMQQRDGFSWLIIFGFICLAVLLVFPESACEGFFVKKQPL